MASGAFDKLKEVTKREPLNKLLYQLKNVNGTMKEVLDKELLKALKLKAVEENVKFSFKE